MEIAIIIAIAGGGMAMVDTDYLWDTPSDVALRLAKRIKATRKRRRITQKQ